MGVPTLVSVGTGSNGAGNVASPTTLTPGLPATRSTGDMLIAFTGCTTNAATASCSTTGWSRVANVSLTNGRIYLFACDVDGTETGPSIVWSGMTTGVSGTPVLSSIACFRSLLNPVAVDVQGSTSDQAANASLAAGGGSAAASDVNSLLLTLSVRSDDVGTWLTLRPNGGLVWQPVDTQGTTSGADAAIHWQWAVTGNPITVPAQTFALTGGTSVVSSGVQIALTEAQATSALGAHTFSPADIAGLQAWFQADTGTSTTTDGVGVSQWDDQSGNGRHLTQSNATTQPLYKTAILNGRPIIRLDGVDDFMLTSSFALNGGSTPTGITIFGVATLTATASFPMLVVWEEGQQELRGSASTGKPEFLAAGTSSGVGTAAINGTGAHVLTGRFSDANNLVECYVDGTQAASAADAGTLTTAANTLLLGARSGPLFPWPGDVGEILVYNTALSDTDRAAVESYLKTKWGTP